MIIVVQNNGIIPDISSTSEKTTSAISQTRPIFITIPNNPKVNILMGRDMLLTWV